MKDKDRSELKKQYEAPAVTQISLRPEEAVLGHCKTAGVGGRVEGTARTSEAV